VEVSPVVTRDHRRIVRAITALVLAVLLVTVATPAPADAGALETVAIVSLVVVGAIVIAYLVVANVRGGRADAAERWVACSAADAACWGAVAPSAVEASPTGVAEAVQAF
jgi:hypothetical protein